MRYLHFAAVVAVSVIDSLARLAAAQPPASTATADELTAACQANTAFAVDLYQQLIKSEKDGNVFCSPFSISLGLTMATAGASGETAEQMAKVLHLPEGAQAGGNAPALLAIHRGQAGLVAGFAPPVGNPQATAEKTRDRDAIDAARERAKELRRLRRYVEAKYADDEADRLTAKLDRPTVAPRGAYELRIANALWAEQTYPFQPSFLNAVQPNYGAVLFPVDFKHAAEPACQRINDWIAEQTNQRIKNLIGPGAVDRQTRMILTNAVYFLGEWEVPFEASATKEVVFQTPKGAKPKVSLMHDRVASTASYSAVNPDGSHFQSPREIPIEMPETDPSLYPRDGGMTLMSLPYKGGKLSMVWLLPRTANGLDKIENMLTADRLRAWLADLDRWTVNAYVPRVRIDATYALRPTLAALGMSRAFTPPGSVKWAQFDAMSAATDPNERLFLTAAVHKTFVEVDEKGTEAAAASFFGGGAGGGFGKPEPPKTKPFVPIFKADHAFIFLIREKETGSILFLGRYLGPKN